VNLLIDIPIWALNALIVLSGMLIALFLSRGARRVLFACSALVFGLLWHFVRGYKQYTDMTCTVNSGDNWLVVFDKCIPSLEADIVVAQAMVLAGVFSIVIIIFKVLEEQYGDGDTS
jgi:hypothetical protein